MGEVRKHDFSIVPVAQFCNSLWFIPSENSKRKIDKSTITIISLIMLWVPEN